MCGICGVASLDPRAPADVDVVVRMRETMAHRGPDGEGVHHDGPVALGHRRLSIIDLSGGRQPMSDASGDLWVTYNGEIFNFREVRAELEAKGRVFRTRSDTEVILHAYAEWGDDCVRPFRGMFAFALWDAPRRRLLLVRDRLGIKPLYWAVAGGSLYFASEVKALLACPAVARRVDPRALADYLRYRYVPGPRTMFAGIHKLPPGHLLVLEDGELRERTYWDLPDEPPVEPGSGVERELLERIEESVRLRLVSDVPLGAFLSGGIDSSTIVGVMSAMATERVRTYSIGYAGGGSEETVNELEFARLAARRFGADHHELELAPERFWESLPRLVWHFDEPVADPAAVPLHFLAAFARESVTVVLSGEGADEILGGYGIYRRMLWLERMRRIPGFVPVASAMQGAVGRRLARYVDGVGEPLHERYRGVSALFSPAEIERLVRPEIADAGAPDATARIAPLAHADPLRQMLYFDLKVWLPDDLLVKADKMTMAASIELRVPFLDHRLVEWTWRLPSDLKIRGGKGKYLLRRAVEDLVPAPILERSKLGFPVPLRGWFRTRLAAHAREVLLDRSGPCARFFRREALEELLARNEQGLDEHSGETYALLVFDLWHRSFIDGEGPSAMALA